MSYPRSISRVIFLGIFTLTLSSCDLSDSIVMLKSAKGWLLGEPSATPSASPSSALDGNPDSEFSSVSARTAQANSELMKEMYKVVLNREPQSRGEFGSWVDTLNQGASLEGVYNGLTHSGEYRKLEISNPGASTEALVAFGQELAYLEVELPVPTEFDALSASPLPFVGSASELNPDSGTMEIDFTRKARPSSGIQPDQPSPSPSVDIAPLAEKYSKQFVGASLFTLKRVIGDEALKVIASKSQYREKCALWYSRWVVRLAQRNIDFGLALRNKPDADFHYKWAIVSPADRMKWEVLNRLNRILNEANRQKQ